MKVNKMSQILLLLSLLSTGFLFAQNWQVINPGLEYGSFPLAVASEYGDSTVEVIRIDPAQYDFELLCASENGQQNRKVTKWVKDFALTAAINAGMFQKDYSTGTGYLVNYQHKNNPYRHSTYNMYFVCNPREEGLPEAQMIDWQQPGAPELIDKYHSVLQCIRMMSTGGINVWTEKSQKWHEAALAQDTAGNILFIYCSSPYNMYELVNLLKQLPLDLDKMMHLEGGPPAAMQVTTPGFELLHSDDFTKIPNVIGIKGK
jgi:uncharacterized protein YigE (DUF2233 family)